MTLYLTASLTSLASGSIPRSEEVDTSTSCSFLLKHLYSMGTVSQDSVQHVQPIDQSDHLRHHVVVLDSTPTNKEVQLVPLLGKVRSHILIVVDANSSCCELCKNRLERYVS